MKRTMMSRAKLVLLAVAVITASRSVFAQSPQDSAQDNVLTYHGNPDCRGNFVVPGLTWQRAKSLHMDEKFPRTCGRQCLCAAASLARTRGELRGCCCGRHGRENKVHALDATTGNAIWTRSLGKPVARSALRCGNISPLGITGTPVIDEARGAIYLDANIADASGPRHRLFCIVAKGTAQLCRDGRSMSSTPLRSVQQSFNSRDQNQRGALTVLGGMLYVPFGGHFGDCGDYHGWVMGVSLQEAAESGRMVDACTAAAVFGLGRHKCRRPVPVRSHGKYFRRFDVEGR